MHFNREHQTLLSRIGLENVKDIEHFRVDYRDIPVDDINNLWDNKRFIQVSGPVHHYACLAMKDGTVYVGKAFCSDQDTYNRKRGYTISLGRALKAATSPIPNRTFMVDTSLEGVSLRDACREALGLPPYTPKES